MDTGRRTILSGREKESPAPDGLESSAMHVSTHGDRIDENASVRGLLAICE